ncbi:hypothetical protein SNL152K_1543 [Streptomyces sp. NL15-2K]|nr:hypothetical protein SNL152K_1543 [Streptomyces sp. NL15-2K]
MSVAVRLPMRRPVRVPVAMAGDVRYGRATRPDGGRRGARAARTGMSRTRTVRTHGMSRSASLSSDFQRGLIRWGHDAGDSSRVVSRSGPDK